jgi:acyl carrier protein
MINLELEIKKFIIDVLALEDITPNDIDSNAELFASEGLGLDSIDALELGVAIKKKYNITINSDDPDISKYFMSVSSLAKFIKKNRE